MDRGDIYPGVLAIGRSGHEQQGTRPVLVVSPRAFNLLTKAPIVLPDYLMGATLHTHCLALAVPLRRLRNENDRSCPSRSTSCPRSELTERRRKLESVPLVN